jgi:tetratricopeptide (TPR) repeat protein
LNLVRDGEQRRVADEVRKAMELAGRASEKERLLIEAWHAKAIERDDPKSIARFKELVTKYPREKEFRRELGSALLRVDPDAAIAELQAALQLDPAFGVAMNELAFALVRKGDYAGARTQLERYIALSPDEFNPRDSLGQVEFMQGLLDSARVHYEKARTINPSVGEELPLAYIAAAQENYDGALALLRTYDQAVPSDGLKADGAAVRALILHLLGRRRAALEEIERGLRLARTANDYLREAVILFERGFVRCDSGNVPGGREDFRAVLALADRVPITALVGRVAAVYGALAARDYAAAEAGLMEARRFQEKSPGGPTVAAVLNQFDIRRRFALGQDEQALKLAEGPLPHKVLGSFTFQISTLLAYNMPVELDQVAQALVRRGALDAALQDYRAAEQQPSPHQSRLPLPARRALREKGRQGARGR